ncbi:MAG TPA: acyl-CoA dehydratase activase [Thermotogota bacterium]|nr:acyl-CoA dehydratase activase [Thermotogota bacterium]HPJ88417.1 acyl-CoA dehydratase activase [Thermotogota bacterium]HPR95416.1 acyl-CoA dehydratase activase [Thermotogota bacterium]
MKKIYVGIDVGSVSVNVVAVDERNRIIFKTYDRTNGQPLEIIRRGLNNLYRFIDGEYEVAGIGTTGSGRELAGTIVGADVIKNEITSHAVATMDEVPDVRTIFEIGGQDSKIILIKDQMVVDFAMNTVCAAGTGSFLDHQAERLNIPIEVFGDLALQSDNEVRIAGRCTVFAESDMIAKQQYGFSKPDIINGLCIALVRNYLNNLGRSKRLEPPFVFQGGVAANKGIVAAFEKEMRHEIIVLPDFNVMGAKGIAIIAKEYLHTKGIKTRFKGFDSLELTFKPSSFICHDCSNNCEVVMIKTEKEIIAIWGDKCGKWKNQKDRLLEDMRNKDKNKVY